MAFIKKVIKLLFSQRQWSKITKSNFAWIQEMNGHNTVS